MKYRHTKYIRTATLLSFLLLITSLSSCKKFLDLKPRDVKVLRTAEDYRDIMGSFLRFFKTANPSQQGKIMGIDEYAFPRMDNSYQLGIYTGETSLKNEPPFVDNNTKLFTTTGRNLLTWNETQHLKWEQDFKFLGGINLVINSIDESIGEDQRLKDRVKGEALTWRAYTLFKLLQLYCPYHDDAYGLPLYLDPSLNVGVAMPERETLTTTYAQIIGDAEAALKLLERTRSTEWNLAYRPEFLHGMLAAVYLFKAGSGAAAPEDYAKAREHAVIAIGQRKPESDPERIKKLFDVSNIEAAQAFQSDEFTVRIIDGQNGLIMRYSHYLHEVGNGQTTVPFRSLYSDTDKRGPIFLKDNATITKWGITGKTYYGYGIAMPFRLAELILIKAESEAKMGKESDAIATLKEFTDARYTVSQPEPLTSQDLLAQIYLERKREFFCENDYIWLDMKRLDEELYREVDDDLYVLKPRDYRYTLPIPASEFRTNKKMVQNPGWENVLIR